MEYIRVNVAKEFPELWKTYTSRLQRGEIVGINSFNNFLKKENINGFSSAGVGGTLGTAQIREDHLMWMKLKWQ
jgi:hypothetical protein